MTYIHGILVAAGGAQVAGGARGVEAVAAGAAAEGGADLGRGDPAGAEGALVHPGLPAERLGEGVGSVEH